MELYRHVIVALREWRHGEDRKPLVLRGARQVGKTTVVHQVAKDYDHFISLNLERKKHAGYFERYQDAREFVDALFLEHNVLRSRAEKTLLFIDEIQEVPAAMTMLRYLYEDTPDVHVVAAGSLLEHRLGEVASFPVGRIQYLYVFPMNYPEFLRAKQQDVLLERLEEGELDSGVHELAMRLFHEYAIIGGMPEVVKNYVRHGDDITRLPRIYERIWGSYRDDVPKYAEHNTSQQVVKHIMSVATSYLDKRITFQGFGNSNYKSREVGEAMRALDAAKVIQLIYPVTEVAPPGIPDLRKSPRLQFMDTGIVNHTLAIQPQLLAVKDMTAAYRGALIPHLVTQELLSIQMYSYQKPNFWVRQKSSSQAEVDLVYEHDGLLLPIEIKSGKVGRLRSLHQFVDRAPHNFAIRMYGGTYSIEQHRTPAGKAFVLMNLPYYLTTYLPIFLRRLVR